MVVKLVASVGVYQPLGQAKALENVSAQNLNAAAFAFEMDRVFADLGIQVGSPEGKNLGKHDGRVEVASLGQFSPPAGAILTANEVRSV